MTRLTLGSDDGLPVTATRNPVNMLRLRHGLVIRLESAPTIHLPSTRSQIVDPASTPNCLTFVKTTAIAYHQNPEALVDFLPICNSSRFYKRQAIRSRYGLLEYWGVGKSLFPSPAEFPCAWKLPRTHNWWFSVGLSALGPSKPRSLL